MTAEVNSRRRFVFQPSARRGNKAHRSWKMFFWQTREKIVVASVYGRGTHQRKLCRYSEDICFSDGRIVRILLRHHPLMNTNYLKEGLSYIELRSKVWPALLMVKDHSMRWYKNWNVSTTNHFRPLPSLLSMQSKPKTRKLVYHFCFKSRTCRLKQAFVAAVNSVMTPIAAIFKKLCVDRRNVFQSGNYQPLLTTSPYYTGTNSWHWVIGWDYSQLFSNTAPKNSITANGPVLWASGCSFNSKIPFMHFFPVTLTEDNLSRVFGCKRWYLTIAIRGFRRTLPKCSWPSVFDWGSRFWRQREYRRF